MIAKLPDEEITPGESIRGFLAILPGPRKEVEIAAACGVSCAQVRGEVARLKVGDARSRALATRVR